MKLCIAVAAAVLFATAPARAQGIDKYRDQGYSVSAVTPVFGQLVKMSFPRNFVPAFQNTKGDFYIQENVLQGEDINNWTQMVSLTGKKELASKPGATARALL